MPRKKPKKAAPSKNKSAPYVLAAQKLSESGLSLEDAELMGIEVLTPEQTSRLGFDALAALKINYLDAKGKPMLDWPKHKPFFRIRYLGQANTFDKITEGKEQRYTQPANTVCCAYFPQHENMDWPTILADATVAIIVTEGELKAACSCKNDFPTIGLGGVYNYRSLKQGVEFLPELEAINWVGRNVYLAFDSDFMTNAMVCRALVEYGEALIERGAYVHIAVLPDLAAEDGKKTGLDDYLMDASQGGPDNFREILHVAQPLGLTRVLFDYNKKYVFIRQPGIVLDQTSMAKIPPAVFKEALEATKTYSENVLKPDGTISFKQVPAAAAWISWPMRHQAERLTYLPGKERRFEGNLNVWPGWGLQPKKGDVKPFMELLTHLFKGAEPEAMQWFLKWLAYPLQHPGTKMFTSAIFHGVTHGTGKSLVGYTLGRIYGQNFSEISQSDLHAGFNEWAEAKQFIMGDDVTGSNKREDNDLLKKLITQKEMRVNIKYVPSYVVPDCINYFFNSNHPDAFFLEDTDRRFFIHEVLVEPMAEKFYSAYAGLPGKPGSSWLERGGAEAVFDFLLKLDLKDFNPSAPAYKTQARARLISDTQSDLGAWVRRLIAMPDEVLKLGEIKLKQDLFTNKELLAIYDPIGRTSVSANGLGRELRRAKVQQVLGGRMVQMPEGGSDRYYAIRNVAAWVNANHGACVKHLQDRGASTPASKKVKF